MVFYNRSFMASGKETERQRLITPSCECFINVFCVMQRLFCSGVEVFLFVNDRLIF